MYSSLLSYQCIIIPLLILVHFEMMSVYNYCGLRKINEWIVYKIVSIIILYNVIIFLVIESKSPEQEIHVQRFINNVNKHFTEETHEKAAKSLTDASQKVFLVIVNYIKFIQIQNCMSLKLHSYSITTLIVQLCLVESSSKAIVHVRSLCNYYFTFLAHRQAQ